MSELVVILTDFFLPPADDRPVSASLVSASPGAARPAGAAALPRLPSLEVLLARAHREPLADDWRGWLARRLGGPPLAPASLVARAWGVQAAGGAEQGGDGARLVGDEPGGDGARVAGASASGYWLATPVHLVAGISRVMMHPAGLLHLGADEQQELVEQFAAQFGDSPWRLYTRGQRELLLGGPALSASGADPARFLCADPSAGLPRGADARALRRLGSELELWLHEHALNRARARRGQLPVTTLWLWGGETSEGGGTGEAGGSGGASQAGGTGGAGGVSGAGGAGGRRVTAYLYGRDTYAEALVQWLGGQCRPLETDAPVDISAVAGGASDLILAHEVHGKATHAAGRLELLERQWLGPALAGLRAGRLHALLLVASDHVYHLRRLDRWRIWHACAPWWEVLG